MKKSFKSRQSKIFNLLLKIVSKITGVLFLFVSFSSTIAIAQSSNDADGKVIMGIFAHPDDEILASTIFHKYIREGAEVVLVTATDGRLGPQ